MNFNIVIFNMIFDEIVSKNNMFGLGMLNWVMTYANCTMGNFVHIGCILMQLTLYPYHLQSARSCNILGLCCRYRHTCLLLRILNHKFSIKTTTSCSFCIKTTQINIRIGLNEKSRILRIPNSKCRSSM